MRFSTFAAIVAASTPLAVQAKGKLGYALGVRNSDGSCKDQGEFSKDLAVLSKTSTIVRTYAAIDNGKDGGPSCYVPRALLPAAKEAGFQVIVGLWADGSDNLASFDKDMDEFFNYASEYEDTIYAVTVGSEALYRNQTKKGAPEASTALPAGLTGPALAKAIESFYKRTEKAKLVGKYKIGTADSWNKYQDGTANPVIQSPYVNILLVNAFAYWQYQPITNATATYFDDLQQAMTIIQAAAGSLDKIELWNGETGWPTEGGTTFGSTIPSTKNAKAFFKQGVCALLDWWEGAGAFYFEAFDEPWKPESLGDNQKLANENHWGAFNADRSPKWDDYSCKYSS